MKLSAESNTVNEILSRNIFLEVPRNQRKYVWTNQQLNELYDDVFNGGSDISHFMGCIVLEQYKEKQSDRYKIIDGQQRLTTYNIILLVISKILFELEEEKKALSNKKYVIGDIDGEEINKISVEESYLCDLIDLTFENIDVNEFQEKLKVNGVKKDKYNINILNCYMFYYKKIHLEISQLNRNEQIKKVLELKNKLLDVNIIEINVPYNANATFGYRVFEVLNARGIPLEQHELIKNYIFTYSKIKKGSKQDKHKNQWGSIVKNLVNEKDDNMNNFFSHYIIHKYGVKASQKKEFEVIKSQCDKSNVSKLLDDLVNKSKYYLYMCNPDEYKKSENYNSKIYNALIFFRNMNIRQVRPFIMSLFSCLDKSQINVQEMEKVILFLENFYFKFVIVCKNKTNNLENLISTYSRKFENEYNNLLFENFRSELIKYKVNKNEFLENFKGIGYSSKNKKFKNSTNKKLVTYILKKIDDYYDKDDEYEITNFSIEHISCDSETEDFTSTIGNLLPLSKKRNNKLGSKSFNEKLKFYEKTNLLTVKKFINNYGKLMTWEKENILNRTSEIAELGYCDVWKI